MIPTLLPALERHGRLTLGNSDRALVLKVSAATIDRLLADTKVASGGRRRRVGFYSAKAPRQYRYDEDEPQHALQGAHGAHRHGVQFIAPGNGPRQPRTSVKLSIAASLSGARLRTHLLPDIDHRLTEPNHHCTNGQGKRMNRTLK